MFYKIINFRFCLPLFFLLCLSGNPFFLDKSYEKELLVAYTVIFSFYTLWRIRGEVEIKLIQHFFIIVAIISIIVFFQNIILGSVSYPGVLALVLKISLGIVTLLYYNIKKIDFIEIYIKILTFLAKVSIPFFIINQFEFFGVELKDSYKKSVLIYTSFIKMPNEPLVRNSGMFWEPGAFAGYLLLAILFIILKNHTFIIGRYKSNLLWISLGLLTSQSSMGFIIFSLIIIIYLFNQYKWGKFIVIPVISIFFIFTYTNLHFLKDKIEGQFYEAINMQKDEISNSRFGAFIMDLQYIKSQPLIGNGLDVSTRFRFHPWVKGDIGHGNGMSNFIACWGVPFFLLWLYLYYLLAKKISRSKGTALISMLFIILILQGEQFLDFPMFLMFFTLYFAYNNIPVVKRSNLRTITLKSNLYENTLDKS